MSVVRTMLSTTTALFFVLSCLTTAIPGVNAETPTKAAKIVKPPRTSRPIITGWEPISKPKPITRGWHTVSKSDVIRKKLNALTDRDYTVALQAVRHALTEIEDGRIYRWQGTDNKLSGKVMPINAFRDKQGRICRHLIYTLALEKYRKTVEGIACRTLNGNWRLSG